MSNSQSFPEKLKAFLSTARGQVVAGIVLTLLTATGLYTYGNSVNANPTPVVEQVAPDARATSTPRPPRVTPTLLFVSETPTLTATPLLTSTTSVTVTPLPPTVTPLPGVALCKNWHPYGVDLRYPSLGAFDMGINPCTLIPVFGETLNAYLFDQDVDGFPKSSAAEEPDGYTWLYARVKENGTQDQLIAPGAGCALFDNNPAEPTPDKLCITNVLYRVHMRGDDAHAKKRHHSGLAIVRACAVANGKPVLPCGVVLTSGLEDWGVKHQPYKTSLCYDGTTPKHFETNELYPLDLKDQPPYVALQPARNGFAHQFISTITFNFIVEPYYMDDFPEFPNHILRATWNLMDATEEFDCSGMEEVKPTGFLATKYILHAIILANLPDTRPFSGFTDANGYVDETCSEIGWNCYPLIITENLPVGIPFMSYPVQMDGKNADGTSTGVIIQDYGP